MYYILSNVVNNNKLKFKKKNRIYKRTEVLG